MEDKRCRGCGANVDLGEPCECHLNERVKYQLFIKVWAATGFMKQGFVCYYLRRAEGIIGGGFADLFKGDDRSHTVQKIKGEMKRMYPGVEIIQTMADPNVESYKLARMRALNWCFKYKQIERI